MTFTPVETIALIIIVIATIKILILLLKPMAWMNFAKKIYLTNPKLTQIIYLVLATLVLYYLLQEMTIVQILAVAAFMSLLIGIGLMPIMGDLFKKYEGIVKRGNIWKDSWLYTLIWIALMVWGVKELFF